MRVRCRRDTDIVDGIIENTSSMPIDQNLGDDVFRELRVALYREVLSRFVHGLDLAEGVGAQGDSVFGELVDYIAMHLMEALRGFKNHQYM